MSVEDADRSRELRELVQMEIADIVATATEQGFTAEETLTAISLAASAAAAAAKPQGDATAEPQA